MQINSCLYQTGELPRQIYVGNLSIPPGNLLKTTENKSYAPISGCVLDHILSYPNLSYLEKLFYIAADALSVISANNGKRRGVALPSYKWASQLGCSRSQVFKLQQSLSDKGYFIIIKDKNKFGQNNRNFIIPTLPCSTFNFLAKSIDRAGQHLPYNFDEECKRAYLDRTKLFIRINYQLLKVITSNDYLSSFHKMIWLDLFTKCYKSQILKNKENNQFSLTISYQELLDRYSCDKRYLSKAMNILEEVGFLMRERLYIKEEKSDQGRQDKSLWHITLSLPNDYAKELLELKDRSNFELNADSLNINDALLKDPLPVWLEYAVKPENTHSSTSTAIVQCGESISNTENTVASYDPDVAEFRPLLTKDLKTNKNIKNIDNLDSKSVFFKKSVSSKNAFKEKAEKNGDFNESRDKELSKRPKLRIELEAITNSANKGVVGTMEQPTDLMNSAYKEKIANLKAEQGKINPNTTSNIPSPSLRSFLASKRLKDLYPLDETLVSELNHKSGRDFSVNFANELLLKLDSKYPLMSFGNSKQILAYLTKAMQHEKHQGEKVNHETFRFARIEPEEQKKEKMEKYLVAIEADLNTNAASQLKRKIAALLETEVAYRLLTESKFTRPQAGIFLVELAHNLNLTETQQERLTNEIQLIYGRNIEVIYNEMKYSPLCNQTSKEERQQDEIYLEELDPDTAWYQVRSALKNQYGNGLDKAWFSKLRAEEDTAQRKITLKAPTRFLKDWIEQKYGSAIENSCKIINYQLDALVT